MYKKNEAIQRTNIIIVWYDFTYGFSIQTGQEISLGKT